MTQTYTYHQDPGHGWIEVSGAELGRLGLVNKISHYSYVKGSTVFLEEDCDASLWVQAKKAAGEEFTTVASHTNYDSFIRSLPRF